MNLTKLSDLLQNEPSFRVKQINKLLFQDLIVDWEKASTLPKILRDKLSRQIPLSVDADCLTSKDGKTAKALITLSDRAKIEAVLMRYEDRNTVCVSSQVGCPLGCVFCATGNMGFKRNLTVDEILEQVLLFARILKKEGKRITSIVYMGMGEPFLNYDNVIESIRILNDPNRFGLGARHFSVSTSGILEGIKKLSQEKLEINLAISLHAPDSNLRSNLMPINTKYPLEKVLNAVDKYIKITNRKVMFEYVMIDGVNDSPENARELAKLMKKPLHLVNLISYNPTGNFLPSSSQKIREFRQILEKEGIEVTQRYSFGRDIEGACGQLATTA